MKWFLFLCCLFVGAGLQAQDIEKLLAQAKQLTEAGTVGSNVESLYSKALSSAEQSSNWALYLRVAAPYSDYLERNGYEGTALKIAAWVVRLESAAVPPSEDWVILYKALARAYYADNDYASALLFSEKTLKMREKIGSTEDLIAREYGNVGQLQSFLGRYDEALKSLEMAIKMQKDELELAYIYNELANVYIRTDNFGKALEYADLGLLLIENQYGGSSVEAAIFCLPKAEVYKKSREYLKALSILQRANRIFKKLETPDVENHYSVLQEIGNVFNSIYDEDKTQRQYLDSALLYLQTAQQSDKLLSTDNALIFANAMAQSAVYRSMGNLPACKMTLDRAYSIAQRLYDTQQPEMADLYQAYGEYYLIAAKDPKMALPYFQKSITALFENYKDENIDALPSENLFAACHSLDNLTNALAWKARASYELYLQTKQKTDLDRAYQTALLYDKIPNYLRKNSADANNVRWADFFFEGYEFAIQISMSLHQLTKDKQYLNQAFYFSEKCKGLSLLQAFQTTKATKLAGIPANMLEKEAKIKLDIAQLEQELYVLSARKNKETLPQIIELQTRITNKREEYNSFIKQLEEDYPEYHKIKYDIRLLSVEDSRTLLAADQALISYFVGERNTYVFKITQDDFDAFAIPLTSPQLLEKVAVLRASIYDYYLNNVEKNDANYRSTANTYAATALDLYQNLLQPLGKLPRRLLIVPDGALSLLPFDALLTEQPADPTLFKGHAYLLLQHSISYSYSATLLQEMQKKKHKPTSGVFLGFAPRFDADANVTIRGKRYNLAPLASNEPEVTQVRELLRTGDIFVGTHATEEKFKELASNFRIIHFATHGLANNEFPDYSLLAFSPIEDTIENEFLYVSDLYNMQLNADLVVLSACETGIGKMARGEGIMSLARGFSFAGAKSIFTTLWSVNDQATANMVLLFYENIQQAQPKDLALQNAKIQFIKAANNEVAHPFFWSPYILIGDSVPLEGLNTTNGWLLWGLFVGGVVVAGAIIAVLRFYSKKKAAEDLIKMTKK